MNMPTLSSHTHCQVAPAETQTKTWRRVCLTNRTDGKRNNEGTTLYKSIAGEVVKSRFVHLMNFCSGGQVIAFKSATALIQEPLPASVKSPTIDKRTTENY